MASARDVARAVGVSVSTVSRALTQPDQVSPATRERVVAAAAKLGYAPHPAARGLRMGRTHAIGLLVPDLENPYFASVTKGVQARASRAGYAVFVVDSDEDPAVEPELLGELTRRVDGVVLASPRSGDDVLERAVDGVPAVLVSRAMPGVPSVAVDDADGMTQALRHLHALGHREIAVAAGPATSWSSDRRVAGLRRSAEVLAGVSLAELGTFAPYFEGGLAAADHAVASGATAVVAFNDLMAVGVLARLRDRGVRVPEEVSVVGFDDVEVGRLFAPALTTVRVPRTSLGRRAVDLVLARLDADGADSAGSRDADPAPLSDELPVELVIRSSTGPPRPPAPPGAGTQESLARG